MGKTHDMLMQAEAIYKKEQNSQDSIENFETKVQAEANYRNEKYNQDSIDDFETKLMRLGLNKKIICKKNIVQLRRILILLNEWIVMLDRALRPGAGKKHYRSSKHLNMKDVAILTDLRKSALERYSALINKQKIENIKTRLSLIADNKLRQEIETNLLQIELKDQIILREYHKLDQIFQKYRP